MLAVFYFGKFMPPQRSSDVLGQLNTFRQNRRNPMDYLRESETRLGLPSSRQRLQGLRGAITNTENLLSGVDPSVTGRTQGSLVTEAQRQRMVNLERAPLADQFKEQSRALEGESANIADLTGRSLTEAQMGIGEQQAQEQSLQSLYGTLFQREQEEEQKRRWEEQQKQWWEDFNMRRAISEREAAALEAQSRATSDAIRRSMSTPASSGGFTSAAPTTRRLPSIPGENIRASSRLPAPKKTPNFLEFLGQAAQNAHNLIPDWLRAWR